MRHPNIAQVLEVGADDAHAGDGGLFIAMELLEGLDVAGLAARTHARGERLSVGAALQIALDAALGLAYAHAKTSLDGEPLDIVHRDVSPQNLVVTVDGVCKVVDFGIAKAKSQTTLTETGTLKGKCAYMAPEQVCGDPFDHRADQFALGVVLWELLTGERLFRRDSDLDTLRAVLAHDVAPPSRYAHGLPAALDQAVLRALAASPDARFPSCAAFADALDDVLFEGVNGRPLRAGPRLLGAVVRDRMKDPRPTHDDVEKTLPTRALLSGIGDELTSVEAAQMPPPRKLNAPAAIGRDAEIETVLRAFADAAPGPVTLVGPSGSGKTHLARSIASMAGASMAFDAAYLVEMTGAESGEDVVTLLGFALGLAPGVLPPDIERAAQHAGKALATRARSGALIVLDGVDDITAGASLLARGLAAHAKVLVTARAPLGVMHERVVDVGPLSLDDAVALLAGAAHLEVPPAMSSPSFADAPRTVIDPQPGRPARRPTTGVHEVVSEERRALEQIAQGAGCLPSALLLAARWLLERKGRPELAAEVQRRTGERSLALLLEGGALHELDDDDRSALYRLAPHRGPLDRALVDTLVPERDPDEVIAHLRQKHALVGDEIVPAVRDRALDELAAKGELVALRRHHAGAVAARAFVEILRAEGPNAGAALAALERLRPALEDAAGTLLADASDDASADADAENGTQLLSVALGLDVLLARSTRHRGGPAHARLLDEAVTRANRGVDKKLRARGLEARADQHKLAGRVHDARRDYLLALDLASSDTAVEALLHRNIADLDLDAGDLVSAEDHARKAVALARKAGSARHMARATWSLGRIALKRGNTAQAEILLERAAAGFREEKDTRFLARATFELARCAEARGDAHAAQALFADAAAALSAEGDVAFAERARVHLGLLAAFLGAPADARVHLDEALESARARGDVRAEWAVREHLAALDPR